MGRQGNSRLTLNNVERALMIMLMGILASTVIAVAFYLTYEVAVGSRDYGIRRTDIPGRAFDICYHVAGVCGSDKFPEEYSISCSTGRILWLSPALLSRYFLNDYLLSPMGYMVGILRREINTPETPILVEHLRQEPSSDRTPGASAVADRDATRRSPYGTPATNLHAESSSGSSSASPLPQDGEIRHFPPATPGPSRANASSDQGAHGGRISVHSFNSPVAAQPASTETHRTDRPDDDISLTESDESESRRDSDQS